MQKGYLTLALTAALAGGAAQAGEVGLDTYLHAGASATIHCATYAYTGSETKGALVSAAFSVGKEAIDPYIRINGQQGNRSMADIKADAVGIAAGLLMCNRYTFNALGLKRDLTKTDASPQQNFVVLPTLDTQRKAGVAVVYRKTF